MLTDDRLTSLYAATSRGASVRGLDFVRKSAVEVHDLLMRAGFSSGRIPVRTVSSTGDVRYARTDGTTTEDPDATQVFAEWLYRHRDGGIVRVYPDGLPGTGLGLDLPCVRKSVAIMSDAGGRDFGLEREAFVVTASGEPVPRSARREHGLRALPSALAERRLALSVVTVGRTALAPGVPPVAPPILRDHIGLSTSRTMAPVGRFEDALRCFESVLASRDVPVVRIERPGLVCLAFPGYTDRSVESMGRCRGLGSVSILLSQFTFRVDPAGYAASIDHLARFLVQLRSSFPFLVYDDATGRDVTRNIEAFPSALCNTTHLYPEPSV